MCIYICSCVYYLQQQHIWELTWKYIARAARAQSVLRMRLFDSFSRQVLRKLRASLRDEMDQEGADGEIAAIISEVRRGPYAVCIGGDFQTTCAKYFVFCICIILCSSCIQLQYNYIHVHALCIILCSVQIIST